MIMTKLTVTDIADEILKVFDLDGEALAVAMEELHNRVKAQEADPEVATKMLTESFLAALRRSNEKELREFARIKFESSGGLDHPRTRGAAFRPHFFMERSSQPQMRGRKGAGSRTTLGHPPLTKQSRRGRPTSAWVRRRLPKTEWEE
jgi:hypothetical protein